jgi:glycosyltransferase involved in cell wall biosynthesis
VARVEGLFVRSTRVAVVARGFERPVRDLGAAEVDYLPNFSLLGAPRSTADATRHRLGIPSDAFTVMYSGNLGYKQDFGSVLEAAEIVGPADSGIVFVIIGEGSQRTWIEQEVGHRRLSNVLLRPLQAEEDLPDVLSAADVLLAPQRPTDVDMSVPSKLTAYLSAGRAVIAGASPQSETARIVEESRGGLVVAPSDGRALAEAVLELRRDPAALARFASAGRQHAEAAFSRGPALVRFVAWAESLLAPAASRP